MRAHFNQITELSRPAETHVAQVIFFDGTNAIRSGGFMPNGFVVSAKSLTDVAGTNTVDLAKAISFGGHGPGSMLDGEHPLHIVCVGDSRDPNFSQDKLLERARAWHASLPPKQQSRIVIEGFTPKL